MNIGISESAAIGAVALLCAIVNVGLGIRAGRCDRTSALSRFSVAFIALVVAVLVFVPIVSPVAGYGVLCLALVSVFLFDLLREEHTRRRRVASLTPRPAAEPVPSVWVAIAVASVLMLAPYVILGEQRAAALIVGACAFVMAGIAWRIASAPMQLEGEDIQTERVRDRASRSRKAGLTAVLAIGSIFVFISFVNADLPAVLPLQRTLLLVSLLTWSGLWAWVMLYGRYLDSLSPSAS
ncbi:MAG: hypothetical protein M3M96_07950 [Candidatus Eremiobacteraeota bacterium]|nr:hypothetical protein [Candidatus Eremiobacteraeota bacterium]